MTNFLLIRHGEPHYETPLITPDAPLTNLGLQKSMATSRKIELAGSEIVVSSPTKRTMQTADIISSELEIPLVIEDGLKEWVADLETLYTTSDIQVQRFQKAFAEYRKNEDFGDDSYERLIDTKKRVLEVLTRYLYCKKVIAVTHSGVMKVFSPRKYRYCGILPISQDSDTIKKLSYKNDYY
ncbi:MAG TPA: histidine phosphatase family protein [Bacilli bacterium]|nr:histidine phosphatase family protein [Bacilli bacterium]